MIKIEWLDGQKDVPNLGTFNTGDIREVPDAIGQALIKQGQAKAVSSEKKSAKKK